MTHEGDILAWLDANAQRRELRRLEREMDRAEADVRAAALRYGREPGPVTECRLMEAARAYAAAEEAWQAAPDPDAP